MSVETVTLPFQTENVTMVLKEWPMVAMTAVTRFQDGLVSMFLDRLLPVLSTTSAETETSKQPTRSVTMATTLMETDVTRTVSLMLILIPVLTLRDRPQFVPHYHLNRNVVMVLLTILRVKTVMMVIPSTEMDAILPVS